MYCKYCGAQNPENSMFCNNCGAKIEKPNISQINFVQPNNMSQPVVNNIPYNMNNQPKKSGNPILLLVCIIFAIFAIVIPLFIGSQNLNESDEKKYAEEKEPASNDKEDMVELSYLGYNFYLPKNYVYTYTDEGMLIVTNSTGDWAISFDTTDTSYEDYSPYADLLKYSFEESGYTNVSYQVKTRKGQEYLDYVMTYDGMTMYLILMPGHTGETLMTFYYPITSNYTVSQVQEIAFEILDNIE